MGKEEIDCLRTLESFRWIRNSTTSISHLSSLKVFKELFDLRTEFLLQDEKETWFISRLPSMKHKPEGEEDVPRMSMVRWNLDSFPRLLPLPVDVYAFDLCSIFKAFSDKLYGFLNCLCSFHNVFPSVLVHSLSPPIDLRSIDRAEDTEVHSKNTRRAKKRAGHITTSGVDHAS